MKVNKMIRQQNIRLSSLKFLLFLFFVVNTYALDLKNAQEQSCFPIKKTASVDLEWMMSVKEWYYPLMSRLDLYRAALELYGNAEKLRESQVYYDSCIKVNFVENVAHVTGFNGKRNLLTWDILSFTDDGVPFQKFTTESGMSGVTYTTLTDNATYVVVVACWDDNEITWGILSTVPKLSEDTVENIYDHAESLGFKREYFEELRYGYCEDEQTNTISVEEGATCAK